MKRPLLFSTTIISFIIFSMMFSKAYACGIGGATGGSKFSWSELKQCSSLTFMPKLIKIKHKNLSIFKICQTELYIRSIDPVQMRCNQEGQCQNIYLFKKKINEIKKCTEYRNGKCIYHREEVIESPSTFSVKVFKIQKKNTLKFLFSKIYSYPECTN